MTKIKIFLIVSFSLFLISCAGIQTVSKYNSAPSAEILLEGKCFVVRVLTSSNTAHVDECTAMAAAKSAIEGFTFGLYDSTLPKESHEQALIQHFEQQKRDCSIEPAYTNRIGDGMGGSHGYEVRFNCKNR